MPTRLASNSEDAVLFKNGDRIRITGTEVVHLRTGRTAVLLTGGVTATGHEALRNVKVTVHLKDLKEKPNELIDLETQATPPIPDSAFRNPRAAASAEEMLAELASMPTGKTTRDENARNLLFVSMDVNANGYLSLVELDGGVKSILPGHAAHAKPAMMQALQAAKVARPESVGRGEEFRVFLLYLRKYLEMLVAFERIDADGDRRLDPEEFSEAVNTGLLAKWGVEVDNPAEAFKEIDQSNEGFISFDEFAHWALHKHLKIEEAQPLQRDSEALEKALKAQELAKELAATLEELGSVAEVAKVKKLVNGVVEYHRAPPKRPDAARTGNPFKNVADLSHRPQWLPSTYTGVMAQYTWQSSLQQKKLGPKVAQRFMLRLERQMKAAREKTPPYVPMPDQHRPWLPTSVSYWHPSSTVVKDAFDMMSSTNSYAGGVRWSPRPPPAAALAWQQKQKEEQRRQAALLGTPSHRPSPTRPGSARPAVASPRTPAARPMSAR